MLLSTDSVRGVGGTSILHTIGYACVVPLTNFTVPSSCSMLAMCARFSKMRSCSTFLPLLLFSPRLLSLLFASAGLASSGRNGGSGVLPVQLGLPRPVESGFTGVALDHH